LSYTEVLLRREGIEINPQMFKRLLADKNMLLLFDGLDEVATLDERKRLVEEIEGFTGCHPGNFVTVTSRPVGYDLARLSNQLFTHATVQDFNDAQIRQFLEQWYTNMLRLSPIPHNDRQELEELFKALKENPRLYKLAENPLLLTVITPLHRYERLPDKRVQVYDRCADILLETWAKLRGTKARWGDIQMAKDDQYACVAYLGFVLHSRSQEDLESGTGVTMPATNVIRTEDSATDVPTKFILKEIKRFLADRNLIPEVKAQSIEAERFLELMQVEAGLIVERGTNQHNESLYGFVHRTFQEYFAAADIHERYQQEVDLNILSDFLGEHLHDPHWREVILLLLGKLKRRPVTLLLRQILEGKIKSRRSQFVEIIQQDLFFICDCLREEIVVENELAEIVIASLNRLIQTPLFQSQRIRAAEYLGQLMHTRQYSRNAQEAFAILNLEAMLDVETNIAIARTIYLTSPIGSNGQQQACHALLNLAQDANLSVEHRIQAADVILSDILAEEVRSEPEEDRQAAHILLNLAQDANLPVEHRIQAASTLIYSSHTKPEEERLAAHVLLNLAQDTNLPVEHRIQAARTLQHPYGRTKPEEERRLAAHILLNLAQDANLPVEHRIQAARPPSYFSLQRQPTHDDEVHQQARQLLLNFMQNQSLTVDQRLQAAERFISSGDEAINTINSSRIQALLVVLGLLNGDAVALYFEKHWRSHYSSHYYPEGLNVTDLSHLIELVQQNALPAYVRNNIYEVLTEMIAQFDQIPNDAYLTQ